MANTITSLIPDVYAALDVVSRELVGFIPSVARDSRADRVALNQTLRSFATPANTAGLNITPAMAFPTAAYQTIANKALTISKSRAFPFSWTGEEQYSLDANGPGYLSIRQDQIAQALRAAVNEVETDLAALAYKNSSRATGTAGTTPFATTLADSANVLKILKDNGAPESDRHLIINTTTGAAVRSLLQLTKANEAADTSLLRQGIILDVHGFVIRESAQLSSVTKGTAAGATTDNAGYAVGATTITLASAGTGTILAGDVVTFAGDSNQYIVATGDSDVSNGGTIVLNAPGLRVAIATSATNITVGGNFTPNVAFTRNAFLLATRLPAVPSEGDLAIHREVITDPRSGLSFELAVYPGYRMMHCEIGLNWGVLAVKPEHSAVLLG